VAFGSRSPPRSGITVASTLHTLAAAAGLSLLLATWPLAFTTVERVPRTSSFSAHGCYSRVVPINCSRIRK